MFFLPKFFYDDNATEGAGGTTEGGSTTDTGEQSTQKTVITNVDVLKPLFSEEEIKGFGFDNVDQLKQHLQENKQNRVPDDIKKKNAEIEKADFIKVSTEEGLMTVDEYSAYEAISKRPDRDLVYEKFVSEYKEDNPEATDELMRSEFESEYKLDSDNAKSKSRGEARLKKEAEDLRSPLSGKNTAAKEFYDNYRVTKKEQPAFIKFIDDLVNDLTPETLSLTKVKDEEDELDVPVKFTKEQRDEISKLFKTPKHFVAYLENKDKLKEALAPGLAKKINNIIKVNNFDNAVSHAFKSGKGVGQSRGSNVGAEQPFGLVKNATKMTVSPTDKQALDQNDTAIRQKYAK